MGPKQGWEPAAVVRLLLLDGARLVLSHRGVIAETATARVIDAEPGAQRQLCARPVVVPNKARSSCHVELVDGEPGLVETGRCSWYRLVFRQ